MADRILLTGASGTLGTQLKKHFDCDSPSHKTFDITKPYPSPLSFMAPHKDYGLIIHCAAYIDVKKAETEKEKCYNINVRGTQNLLLDFPDVPFVFISTEHANNPVNYYCETKLGAETAIKALSKQYLIIRTLFKAVPYPYDQAFTDRYTCGDEVTIIAPLVAKAIQEWDRKTSKTIYIGTGRKTFYDIAIKSRTNVRKCTIKDITGVKLPVDYK
jgi:dTDP-4-dehydrorhamnose reductase